MITISIADDFTRLPGPRRPDQGPGSGREFLEKHLRPAFQRARDANDRLTVQLDGVRYGYPTSFLEEAFGGLAREFGSDAVQGTLLFETRTEPMLDNEIRHYIKHADDPPGERSRAAI